MGKVAEDPDASSVTACGSLQPPLMPAPGGVSGDLKENGPQKEWHY